MSKMPESLAALAGALMVAAACEPASRAGNGTPAQASIGESIMAGSIRSIQVADGVHLAYTERGDGEPVVLVHGSLADLSYWDKSQQAEFLASEYRVIAYSRRYNHPNRTIPTGNHSPWVEAEDLAKFLDALGMPSVHLVGHSYGAYTALAFALEHPSRLRSLVLAEPPIISWLPDIPGGEGIFEGFMAGVWEPLAAAFRESDEAGLDFTARWYFQQPFEQVDPMWQQLFRDNVAEWRELAASSLTFPNLEYARVRALRVPTLIVSGERNAGGFNDLIDGQLHTLIPVSERIVIPDATHEMFLDAPLETAAVMRRHFARQQRPH